MDREESSTTLMDWRAGNWVHGRSSEPFLSCSLRSSMWSFPFCTGEPGLMSNRSFTTEEVDSSPSLLLEQITSTRRWISGESCIHNQLVGLSLAVLYFRLHFRCLALVHKENDQLSDTAETDGLQLDSAFGVTSGVTSQSVEGGTAPPLKVNCFSPLHPYTHRTQRLVWVPWCDSRNRLAAVNSRDKNRLEKRSSRRAWCTFGRHFLSSASARCAVAHVRLRWRRRRRLVAVGENFLFSSLAWQLGRRKGLFLHRHEATAPSLAKQNVSTQSTQRLPLAYLSTKPMLTTCGAGRAGEIKRTLRHFHCTKPWNIEKAQPQGCCLKISTVHRRYVPLIHS